MSRNEIGNLIKEKREAKGFSIRELAKKMNVAPSTISRIESGETKSAKGTVIAKLATVLELSSEEINLLLLGQQ